MFFCSTGFQPVPSRSARVAKPVLQKIKSEFNIETHWNTDDQTRKVAIPNLIQTIAGKPAFRDRSFADFGTQIHRSAECVHRVFYDRQAKARAAPGGAAPRRVDLIESLEDSIQMLLRDADAGVDDTKDRVAVLRFDLQCDGSAGRGEFHAVFDQVFHDEIDQPPVAGEGELVVA